MGRKVGTSWLARPVWLSSVVQSRLVTRAVNVVALVAVEPDDLAFDSNEASVPIFVFLVE